MHFRISSRRLAAVVILGASLSVGFDQESFAKSFAFLFRNNSGTDLQYQLFATGRDIVWPGAARFYTIPANSKVHNAAISCELGEKICFGAWIEGRTDFYWGVGRSKTNACSHCCYVCRGQATEIINLNPPNLAVTPEPSAVNTSTVRPSFDCNGNLNEAEQTVCNNADLCQIDANMSSTYNRLLAERKGPATLRDDQRAFLRRRDACGADVECLNKAYWERFNDLAWINGQGHEDR
jgi:uncharacterized protein YecT (DUF1311 family)